jgi:hypothetical protein
MPEISTTALEKRIREYAPNESKGRVKAAAKRIAWRMVNAAEIDFFTELRILGITNDPTPKQAIRNLERTAAPAI